MLLLEDCVIKLAELDQDRNAQNLKYQTSFPCLFYNICLNFTVPKPSSFANAEAETHQKVVTELNQNRWSSLFHGTLCSTLVRSVTIAGWEHSERWSVLLMAFPKASKATTEGPLPFQRVCDAAEGWHWWTHSFSSGLNIYLSFTSAPFVLLTGIKTPYCQQDQHWFLGRDLASIRYWVCLQLCLLGLSCLLEFRVKGCKNRKRSDCRSGRHKCCSADAPPPLPRTFT